MQGLGVPLPRRLEIANKTTTTDPIAAWGSGRASKDTPSLSEAIDNGLYSLSLGLMARARGIQLCGESIEKGISSVGQSVQVGAGFIAAAWTINTVIDKVGP
jgi:hypothetical protein